MLLANTGIPIVCVALPTMLIALPLIAGVESLVYHKWLGRSFRDAFWGALIANAWSTLVGVPLTWLPLVAGQMAMGGGSGWGMDTSQQRFEAVTLQAAWLMPYEDHLAWMIPAASMVLLLPFYLGSVLVEYLALTNRWSAVERRPLIMSVLAANGLSYIGLGVYYGIQLWLALC